MILHNQSLVEDTNKSSSAALSLNMRQMLISLLANLAKNFILRDKFMDTWKIEHGLTFGDDNGRCCLK